MTSFSWDKTPDIQARQRLFVISQHFDADPALLPTILPYIEHKGPVSLRIIEWFVTNYSKIYFPDIYRKYISYRNNWKRPLFDCFARQGRRSVLIYLHFEDRKYPTTVAQLHYLVWAYLNSVLKHCVALETAIEDHMVQTLKQNQQTKELAKKLGLEKKRSTLTKVQIKNACVVHTVATDVQLSND